MSPVAAIARSRRARGFTLLEVLVALGIVALSAIVLVSAYLNILNSYDIAQKTNRSTADLEFARSIVLTEPDITKLQNGGDFDSADGHHLKWSVDIQPTTTADLFTVTFTCETTDSDNPNPEKTVDTFMVMRPTWSTDPAARSKLREDAKTRILEMQGKNKPQ